MTHERASDWATCPQLYIAEAGRRARAIALANTMTVGRDNANDIVLDSITVSRYHAVLLCDASGVRLIDLESTNGTSVNGVPVPSDEAVALNNGTLIQLGQVRARYYEPTSSNSYSRFQIDRAPEDTDITEQENQTSVSSMAQFICSSF
jgi:pSer/pThr/pTyr-binding forkhead associated (FHA) protein